MKKLPNNLRQSLENKWKCLRTLSLACFLHTMPSIKMFEEFYSHNPQITIIKETFDYLTNYKNNE